MKLFDRFKKPQNQPWNRWDLVFLGSSAAVFSALSLFNMARFSVWFDEAFGLYLIRSDYMEVARLTSLDVHPPMYYWALKAWTSVFGTSELAIRSLSLFFLLIAFTLIYVLVRRFFGQKAAAFSVALLAICPLLLRYSTEARMYGMTTAIIAGSTLLLASAIQKPTRLKWIGYGLLVSLGLWTHYFTAVAFAAQWVWRYTTVRRKSARASLKEFFSKDWIMAHVVAVATYLPWAYFAVKQLATVQGGGFWISPITPASPLGFMTDTLMYRTNAEATGWFAVVLWAIVILLILLALRLRKSLRGEQKQYYLLIACMAFVPLLLMLVASLPPLRPALVDRYILPSAAFTVVFMAITIAMTISQPKKWNKQAVALLSLVGVAMVSGIIYVYQVGNMNKDSGNDTQPIWPTLQLVWSNSKLNEPTLVGGVTRYYEVAYYEDRAPVGTGVFFVANDELNWGSYEPIRGKTSAKVQDIVQFARQNGGTIWYIGDWPTEGQPTLPKTGSWKVIQELHAPSLPNGKSSIRAVEIELQN